MQTSEEQVRVGIFVFAGVFLAMIVIFLLGGNKQLFERQYTLQTYFDNISGLRVGASVQLAGVNVGLVDKISFAPQLGDKRVTVKLTLKKEYQDRIRKDSIAAIVTQGLLGDKLVAITLGSPDQPILQDGDEIGPDKGGELMGRLNGAAKSITTILDEIENGNGLLHSLIFETKARPLGQNVSETAKQLSGASTELNSILAKVNNGDGTIGALVNDPGVYNDIRALFGKLERNKLLRHVIRSRIKDLDLQQDSPQSNGQPKP
jgi:phospholipid/cholesterol/gamma-HCH transport system substrate-binding protein